MLPLEATVVAQKKRKTPDDKNEKSYPWTLGPSSLIHFLCNNTNYTSLDQREEMDCGAWMEGCIW